MLYLIQLFITNHIMDDILYTIMTFSHIKDILTHATISKSFGKIYNMQIIWKNLLSQNFPNIKLFKLNHYNTYKCCHKLKKFALHTNHNDINTLYNAQLLNIHNKNFTIIPPEICCLHN